MDASYKIQRGIHVHLIQFFMCPEFWVHITSVAICFYLNRFRFKQNSNHVPIDCYIYNLSIFSLIHLMNKGVFVKCVEFVYLYN